MPACPAGDSGSENLSVHECLTRFGPLYLERFGSAMPERQRQVLIRLLSCRTPALGGELWACPHCHQFHYRYHSCQDRHCPRCGKTEADQWLAQQRARLLLPVPYFLVTFTVPDPLRSWIRSHPQVGYSLLFDTSAQALQDLAQNPKRLGAQLGMLGVLHTWSRTLLYHPHVHYLVPGGGLSSDQRQWKACPHPHFLLPGKPLAQHFRTLVAQQFKKAHPGAMARLPASLWKQPWVVDLQPVGSGENALAYLARYIFKTATSNRSLSRLPSGQLLWPYRDAHTRQPKSIRLDPMELIRRFLQHVLPKRFCRVRLFGWLHPSAKLRANRVRALLGQPPLLTPREHQTWLGSDSAAPEQESTEPAPQTELIPAPQCPRCRRPMVCIGSWRSGHSPFSPTRPRAP